MKRKPTAGTSAVWPSAGPEQCQVTTVERKGWVPDLHSQAYPSPLESSPLRGSVRF